MKSDNSNRSRAEPGRGFASDDAARSGALATAEPTWPTSAQSRRAAQLPQTPPSFRLEWLGPIKALAIIGILLDHLVEEFGPGPWFTNPGNNWPDLATRLRTFFPQTDSLPLAIIQFLGWLGDSGPGVFILASGIGLTLSALRRPDPSIRVGDFLRRRVLRLFPLYIAMHFAIFGTALLVPGNSLRFSGPQVLLSLLGLRFTDGLFFFISPSWWFVWLILQLYVVFPLLFTLMRRVGPGPFLFLAVAATVLSRGLGILFSDSLYYWMTGMFFGTRLAEFAAGMVLAVWILRRIEGDIPHPSARAVFWFALPVYVLGLGTATVLATTVVSNLLVTLGLSGLFYVCWEAVLKRNTAVARSVVWIGAASYAVFLLHQPLLKWTVATLEGRPVLGSMAAVFTLIISFPLSVAIERGTDRLRELGKDIGTAGWQRLIAAGTASGLLVALLIMEPGLYRDGWYYRFFYFATAVASAGLAYFEWVLPAGEVWGERVWRRGALAAGLLQLFVLPAGFGYLAVITGGIIGAVLSIAELVARTRARTYVFGGVAAVVSLAVLELLVRVFAPAEAGHWGERPALEPHETRVYALKPNLEIDLHYNDYDYVLRTNSQGLASPEISPARPTADALRILVIGDAFSMPEALPYAESYPALLEGALDRCLAPRQVQVINGGVTGYGPAEQLPQLRELAPLYRPDIVVYQFFINEFRNQNATREARYRSIGFLPRYDSRRRQFLEELHLAAHAAEWWGAITDPLWGKDTAARYGKALLYYYRTGDNPLYSQENIAKLRYNLEEMKRVTEANGGTFLIYYVPGAVAVSAPQDIEYWPADLDLADSDGYDLGLPLRHLRNVGEELSIAIVDLTDALKASPIQPVYYRDAWHWNRTGHAVAAETIRASLAARGLISSACR